MKFQLFLDTTNEQLTAAWFEGFERKHRNMDFFEWIQENQEDLPLGYSKANLLKLYVQKEVLGE